MARRLFALVAIAARGLFDVNSAAGHEPAYSLEKLRDWTKALGLDDELEASEQRVLSTAPSELTQRQLLDGIWGIEGAAILAWALQLAPWPSYDEPIDVDPLLASVGFLNAARGLQIVATAELRPHDELEAARRRLLAYHWRMKDFSVQPRALRFDRIDIFGGPFDLSWAKLQDGDLCLNGAPISEADHDAIGVCMSISAERFRAANWLSGMSETFSRTPTDT